MLKYYSSLGLTEVISEFLEYSSPLCAYWLIIFDPIYHQRTHILFWKTFEQIIIEHFDNQADFNFRNYLIKLIEFFGIKIFTIFGRILLYDEVMVGIAYDILFKLCQVRLFYYLFCLEVLHSQLIVIQAELETINIENSLTRIRFANSLKLHRFRRYFHFVHKMFELLHQMCGCSNVAAILFCFYLILTEANWTFIHFSADSHAKRIRK